MKRANEATVVFAYQEFVREATDVLDHIAMDTESFERQVDSARLQALATRLRELMTTDRQSYVFLMTNTELWDRLLRKLLHGLGVHVHTLRPVAMTYGEILYMLAKAESDALHETLIGENAWLRIKEVALDFRTCYEDLLLRMPETNAPDQYWSDTLMYALLDLTRNGPYVMAKAGWRHASPDLFEMTLWLVYDTLFDPEMVQFYRAADSSKLLEDSLADFLRDQIDRELGTEEELFGALRDVLRRVIEAYTSEANREFRANFAHNLQARMYQELMNQVYAFQEADNTDTIVPLVLLPQSYQLFWYLVHFSMPDGHADENGATVPMFHANKT